MDIECTSLLLFWDKVVPACLVVLVTGVLAAGGHYFLFPDPCKCGLTRIEAFEEVVADHIWGQQVATGMVVEAMKAHRAARKRNPLVMSLHGGPGTGKTAMSMLLARSMFGHKDDEELGTSGVYVIDKPVGATREEYREFIMTTLDGALKSARGSLVVFQDMASVPGNIGSLLKAIFEDSDHNYPCKNEAIFLLSTHIGSKNLEDVALDSWKDGIDRDRINRRELQAAITAASSDTDDRWHRRMIEHNLITKSIPFLPLDRSTVRRCIIQEMIYLRFLDEDRKSKDVQAAMRRRKFNPVTHPVFAETGCANISLTV
ncbi:torsin-1A-like isoform X2 [Mya arenaria]|uniref:torsin-1A-like n=1 Tax=Mya arenaria TaxID=6604 RepID=UPI0022E47203|nr:torsin-1A-like [Mya arenaria]XP_052762661.1 torsin-1A-like isoform X2 [Mya arenaria]